MKKHLFLLPLILLTSCGKNNIPSNEPYYCKGIYHNWPIGLPMYAIDGELVKNGKELFFVNRTKTEHGFHGKIDEKTEFFDNNVKKTKEDFEFKENMKVIAMFNPSANADVWIKISNIPIPENVFRIYSNTSISVIENDFMNLSYDEQK